MTKRLKYQTSEEIQASESFDDSLHEKSDFYSKNQVELLRDRLEILEKTMNAFFMKEPGKGNMEDIIGTFGRDGVLIGKKGRLN